MTHTPEPFTPGFKRDDNNDMIPVGLVRAMFALAFLTLALVGFATLSGRAPAAIPDNGAIVQEWQLRLVAGTAQAVTVQAADGTHIDRLDHGGFVTVVQNGLQTARHRYGVDATLPLRIVAYENGRMSAIDDHTNYRVELDVFGADNKAAFERLLTLLNN
ncbi:MAG: photosynthetic complex assembly protein [Rhodobacteraceae bacterium]|nr:photosynthetic complex assembly protein [Paracoccaceae bacterium]